MSRRLEDPEFSGLKGRFFAWMLTGPLRRVLDWKMGKPDDRVLELLRLEGTERVLDAGSGSGFHSMMIAERLTEGRVVAVDVSTEMLARLRSNVASRGLSDRIEAMHADGVTLPLPDGSFDRAVSVAVWHHLDDPEGAGAELARVLRPGGRAVVVDLELSSADHGHGHHRRSFLQDDMQRILEGSGLVDVTVETIGRWIVGAGDKPM